MKSPLSPWLELSRAIVRDIGAVLAELSTRAARSDIVGAGSGGDQTTAIDAAAESAAVARLAQLHAQGHQFRLVSEELGERAFGGGPIHVVLDPIDGSLNAKRGIPYFSVSLAVADGPTMADVLFGFVHDFGTGEEWTATRGGGAFLGGRKIDWAGPDDDIEILSCEATRTALVAEVAAEFSGMARRLRIMGSLALSLCHLAAGRVDAVCSLRPARSVDIAAAQLLVRERGLEIGLIDDGRLDDAPLDVVARSRVAAAAPAAYARVAAALGR